MAADDRDVGFEVDDAACRLALAGEPAALPASLRAAVERAEKRRGPDGADRCRVRCSAAEAYAMREYFEQIAAALQGRGEYDRSTACARTAERIRRALEGRPLS
jgi:hypothetical protein